MAAAGLAYALLNIAVTRISVPPLDFLLSYAIISCAVTVLAVAALANAVNIIDGFNGLASMVSVHDVRVARLRGVPGARSRSCCRGRSS